MSSLNCKACGARSHDPCKHCGKTFHVGDWPWCPHEPSSRRDAQGFQPVVVFKSKAGKIRIPGRADARTPRGYERVELTNRREIDKVCREMTAQEKLKYEEHKQRDRNGFKKIQSEMRKQLREQMKSWGQWERAFAEAAMAASDREESKSYDPGVYLEAFEYDASNRSGHFDRDFSLPFERPRK